MKFNALSITIKNHKGECFAEHVFENGNECEVLEESVQEAIRFAEPNLEKQSYDTDFAKVQWFLEDIQRCAEAMRDKKDL